MVQSKIVTIGPVFILSDVFLAVAVVSAKAPYLRSYDGNCNENVFRDYSMLITLYKIGELHFRLLGTNGFHVKAKNERFTAASSRCRQNLKYENFTSSFGRLRQNIAPESVPHVQHDYFSSFNQSNHWFVALSLMMPSSILKLPKFGNISCCHLADYVREL